MMRVPLYALAIFLMMLNGSQAFDYKTSCDKILGHPLDNTNSFNGNLQEDLTLREIRQGIEHCKIALEENQANPRIWYQLGRGYDWTGDDDSAFYHYSQSIARAPTEYAIPWFNLGLFYEAKKFDYRRAENYYSTAIRYGFEPARWAKGGLLVEKLNRCAEGLSELRNAPLDARVYTAHAARQTMEWATSVCTARACECRNPCSAADVGRVDLSCYRNSCGNWCRF